jgi:hypothetical protein
MIKPGEIQKIAAAQGLRDTQIEKDALGTRVQTYIQDDYYELASLSIAMKAIIGPIGQFAYVKQSEINILLAIMLLTKRKH